MFTTERLRLRAYLPTDDEAVYTLFNDQRILHYGLPDFLVPHGYKYVEEQILAPLQGLAVGGSLVCMIDELNGGTVVGSVFGVYADVSMSTMGIAILFKPEVWNRGYATETLMFVLGYAFQSLGVHRVEAQCMDGNVASIALFRKLGFVEEGRLKKMFWIGGAWIDVLNFAMLEEEWFSRTNETRLDKP